MDNSTFVYGSELQGRGYTTDRDLIFGYATTLISLIAFTGSLINLFLIKNLKNFHNAFGFFWAVRTVGDLGSTIASGMYAGPITILQPTYIPPWLVIFAYQFSITFSYVQCVMNLAIAMNRFVAVCFPIRYKMIFNKSLCIGVALCVLFQALFLVSLYFNSCRLPDVPITIGFKMNGSTFVYGSELQGRGYTTDTDLIFGYITTLVGLSAFIGALINLYLIKNLTMFHNSFGFLWAVRTVGETGSDLTSALYTGPVTILQLTNIPPWLGIFSYQFTISFAFVQCVMNLVIAVNRFVAVCYPLRYKSIFKRNLCIATVLLAIFIALLVMTLHFIFPCNHIGYGPRFYSNVFVKCVAGMERDYSYISSNYVRACVTVACFGTGLINATTFCKIVYIRLASVAIYNTKEFKRDVRLFTLGVVQDILMTIVGLAMITTNNGKEIGAVGILLSYDGLIFIYNFNSASMIFFNPECRRFLFSRRSITSIVSPGNDNPVPGSK
ncbi:hypothetical protein QR680_011124 [Steinernema hermaphroditum]|uniref:7TM GPCR serpentine receptor class x (Srx) domain-containing protein n=1 Tax=Steinernema hermaphroditum TaxID=289476 RepID=A0AA39MCT9_9BILA|nr:hypothetical protein QR680_011124 [Steinernema hermaphroditum]